MILRSVITLEDQPWWALGFGRRKASAARVRYLSEKMLDAERKIETLERKDKELKKVLARGG